MQGFDHIVVYDDFSADNATLLNELYIQHDRHYLTVEQGIWDEDPRIRRIKSAWDCYAKYKDQSDWLIHLDIDEFIWSPIYPDLPAYFLHEISTETHIAYAGATRFGFNGQKSRHSYALHRVQNFHPRACPSKAALPGIHFSGNDPALTCILCMMTTKKHALL